MRSEVDQPAGPDDPRSPNPGKAPLGRGWGTRRLSTRALFAIFRRHPGAGVGLVLGPAAGVVDLEVDDRGQAGPLLTEWFPGGPPPTLGWESSRGEHRLFRWDDRLAQAGSSVLHLAEGALEFRLGSGGKQLGAVCPPSRGVDAEIFERWVARRSSRHTQRAYRQDVMDFVEFLGIRWPEESTRLFTVSVADVLAFRDLMLDETKAPKTINRRVASLSSFYKYLQGVASEFRLPITIPNPAHAQFIPRGSSDPRDDVLRRLPSHPANQLDELLPDVWFASHPSARRKRAA
jgi:hypothetical protein